jgi:hypothetical protein
MPKYSMPLASLKAVINPLDGKTWRVEPIDPEEIWAAESRSEVCEHPWQKMQEEGMPPGLHRMFHIRRIAYLLGVKAALTMSIKWCFASRWIGPGSRMATIEPLLRSFGATPKLNCILQRAGNLIYSKRFQDSRPSPKVDEDHLLIPS